ncbi:aldose 1-epimerase family protein [Clostridium sp.]|uniref:aldose 1-epimerase family protein n=1 Tax=Clostridium sp. TaxID=1506 RepID=UPI003522F00F
MLYTLENEKIKITISNQGAELHNITSKVDGTEYLWNRNKRYWGYSAPVLFPIVGKVNNGSYRVDGKEYNLPQHGLARLKEFEMIKKTDDNIVFELVDSEETLKVYPYKFSLKISYTLLEDGVITEYIVENTDNKMIYFSIGAHPAFMCPIMPGEIIDDYYFEFNEKENCDIMPINKDGYIKRERKQYLVDNNIIPLSFDLFKGDALVFDSLKSNKIRLKSVNHDKVLTMDFTGFPYMGLWTKSTGAPFVCIEPWYGHADFEDFTGELKDKDGIQKLDIGEKFNSSYTVTIK